MLFFLRDRRDLTDSLPHNSWLLEMAPISVLGEEARVVIRKFPLDRYLPQTLHALVRPFRESDLYS